MKNIKYKGKVLIPTETNRLCSVCFFWTKDIDCRELIKNKSIPDCCEPKNLIFVEK